MNNSKLYDFVLDVRTGKPKRGATAAIARHMGVSFNCAKRWISGEWAIPPGKMELISAMIRGGYPIAEKKSRIVRR